MKTSQVSKSQEYPLIKGIIEPTFQYQNSLANSNSLLVLSIFPMEQSQVIHQSDLVLNHPAQRHTIVELQTLIKQFHSLLLLASYQPTTGHDDVN